MSNNRGKFLHSLKLGKCDLLEGIKEALDVVCRLVLQDFYASFHLRRDEKSEFRS